MNSDIILTTYLTSKKDANHRKWCSKDKSANVNDFISTAEKNNLSTIIFYDNLSKDFIENWSSDLTTFKKADIDVKNSKYSMNDIRFFMWRDYVSQENAIDKVLLADLFDIEFFTNPFDLFDAYPDIKLFTGSTSGNKDIGKKTNIMRKLKKCYGNTFHHNKQAVGAGNTMGRRNDVLKLLNRMCDDFEKFNKGKDRNFNMCVYNKVVYDLFDKDEILIGRPFSVHRSKDKWSEDYQFCLKHLFGRRKESR